jgi:hypothetical protein
VNPQKIAADFGISVDEVRQRWLGLRVAMWKADFRKFCRDVVRIRAKDGSLSPLIFNEAQEILHSSVEKMLDETRWVRITGLKGRRQGYSTYTAARGYWRATLWDRQHIYILSHEMQSSNVLFDMVALMQEQHPFPPAVGTDNAKELEFVKRGSKYTVATAGQKAGGRGGAVSYFHGSEVSRWTSAEDHFSSSVQGVDEVRGVRGVLWQEPAKPLPFEAGIGKIEGWIKAPSEVILETTSAGPTGAFYHRYMDAMKGIGDYRHVFVPWFVQKEYQREGEFVPSQEVDEDFGMSEAEYQTVYKLTDAQMLWRRGKLHELGSAGLMFQEYPSDIMEGFSGADTESCFIKPALVLKGRKRQMSDPDAPLIVGVDPAGAGGDRFAVALRRGDKVIDIRHRNRLEHDEAVAWLSAIIDEEKPSFMVLDKGSMGGNILSSLRNINPEYAAILRGVDFGGKSRIKLANPNRAGPWNRRAELYGKFRDWLTDGGCIPDDDDLASDISAPKIKYRANNDWLLESKSDMKSRGIRSTDLSDAVVLTFGVNEWVETWTPPRKQTGFTSGVDRTQVSSNNGLNTNPHGWMM